jgi:hypothetical protein
MQSPEQFKDVIVPEDTGVPVHESEVAKRHCSLFQHSRFLRLAQVAPRSL